MLVILAIFAYYLGLYASFAALFLTGFITAQFRHPMAIVPLSLTVLWVLGSVDFRNYFDGPMRIDADMNLVGTGAGVPAVLSNGAGGPAWWIAALCALTFAVLLFWPKLPNLRTVSVIGLISLAVSLAGIAALAAMY